MEEIAPEELNEGIIATDETNVNNKEKKNSGIQEPIENANQDPIAEHTENQVIEEDKGIEEENQVETYSAIEDFGKFMKDGLLPEEENEDDNEEDDEDDDE